MHLLPTTVTASPGSVSVSVSLYKVQLLPPGHIYNVPTAEFRFPPFAVPSIPQASQSQTLQSQPPLSQPPNQFCMQGTLRWQPEQPGSSETCNHQLQEAHIAIACYEEAINSIDNHLWKETICGKLHSMEQHPVWTVVPKMPSTRAVGRKWLLERGISSQRIRLAFLPV